MKHDALSQLTRLVLIGLALCLMLIPVFWMGTMAFKPITECNPPPEELTWLPQNPTLENLRFLFGQGTNELIISLERTATGPVISSLLAGLLGTLIAVTAGTMAAYANARFKAGSNLPLGLSQLRLFPPAAVIIPIMMMWTYLALVDTVFGLALIYGIVNMPFAFWLMKTFFDELPREIEDAARVEGCSYWRVFRKISLPLMGGPWPVRRSLSLSCAGAIISSRCF